MTLAQHLFISKNGIMLASWQAAFPSALAMLASAPPPAALRPAMLWLRLASDATVAQQIAAVRRHFGALPLIVMSDVPDDTEALAVFSVAARGYCNAHAGAEVLLNVASVVEQGGLWIGESVMQRLMRMPQPDAVTTNAPANAWDADLTGREREVAKTVTLGLSNKEIAAQLGITERTVKAHVGAVLDKLQLKSRLQLALIVKNS